MQRVLLGATLVLCTTASVFSADYPILRPSYEPGWEVNSEESLRFEAGLRYWYAWSKHEHELPGRSESIDSTSHIGEAFARVEDDYTRSYVEAYGGYGIAHDGTYNINGGSNLDLPAVRLGYVGADFAWLAFGNEAGGVGPVVGYQYTNDSPDTGRRDFTTAQTSSDITWSDSTGLWSVGEDSEVNNLDIHGLKLGVAGKFDAGMFDITGELTSTPYAWVNGTYGAYGVDTFTNGTQTFQQASATSINGFGYGVGGKAMIGFHPTENFTVRVGGRASYLQGAYDTTFDSVTITHPTPNPPVVDPNTGALTPADPQYSAPTLSRQKYIMDNNPFSMLRYGLLLEVAGRF
jgi:hypothetical protein